MHAPSGPPQPSTCPCPLSVATCGRAATQIGAPFEISHDRTDDDSTKQTRGEATPPSELSCATGGNFSHPSASLLSLDANTAAALLSQLSTVLHTTSATHFTSGWPVGAFTASSAEVSRHEGWWGVLALGGGEEVYSFLYSTLSCCPIESLYATTRRRGRCSIPASRISVSRSMCRWVLKSPREPVA